MSKYAIAVDCELQAKGSASGSVVIKGFPFNGVANTGSTNDGYAAMTVGAVGAWGGNMPDAGTLVTDKFYLVYRTTANGASNDMAVADVGTGANANDIFIAGTYICA